MSLAVGPSASPSSSNIIPCGTEKYTAKEGNHQIGEVKNPCGFDHIFILINNFIKYFILYIAIPLAAIMFCYAGFLLVTSGGSEESWGKAKGLMWNVVIGLVLVAGAWLIVNLILVVLGYNSSFNWFGLVK